MVLLDHYDWIAPPDGALLQRFYPGIRLQPRWKCHRYQAHLAQPNVEILGKPQRSCLDLLIYFALNPTHAFELGMIATRDTL